MRRSRSIGSIAALSAAALMLLAADARADEAAVSRADDRGRLHVYAGLFGSAHLVAGQSTDYRRGYLDHGGGGGAFAGVRLDRFWAIELGWRTTVNGEEFESARVTNIPLERLAVTTVGVGPRLYLPVPIEWIAQPYAQASAGYSAILVRFTDCPDCDTVFAKGPAAELGGGVDFRLGRRLSAGLRATGQLLHFGSDAFEKRFRQGGFEPSRTQATILSLATDAYAMFHF
jgi:hypothetical protein